jgi:hypothetical protein
LQPGEHFTRDRRELVAAVIDRGLRHRAQDAIGNVGGAGNLQEMTAGTVGSHAKDNPIRLPQKHCHEDTKNTKKS